MAKYEFPGIYFGADDFGGYRCNLPCNKEIYLKLNSSYNTSQSQMKQFIIKSTTLTFIVFILGLILYNTILRAYYFATLPFVLLFFYLVTNLVHAYLLKIADKTSAKFTSQYMAISYIKMFFYLAVAIVFVILNKENAKVFIANFLLFYIIYTVFEVSEFLKKIKQTK